MRSDEYANPRSKNQQLATSFINFLCACCDIFDCLLGHMSLLWCIQRKKCLTNRRVCILISHFAFWILDFAFSFAFAFALFCLAVPCCLLVPLCVCAFVHLHSRFCLFVLVLCCIFVFLCFCVLVTFVCFHFCSFCVFVVLWFWFWFCIIHSKGWEKSRKTGGKGKVIN